MTDEPQEDHEDNVQIIKVEREKLGITFGAFDLLHSGHIFLFNQAKMFCHRLIVGLHINPNIENKEKNEPIQGVFERYTQLINLYSVDQVIPYETEADLRNIITYYPLSYRFIGSDYRDKDFTGKEICDRKKIKIIYVPRDHDISSSNIRKTIISKSLH